MAKKQVLTNADIEKDIITSLKTPQNESEASYKSFTIPAVIIAIILVVIEFIYPIFILWLFLALIVFGSGISIFHRLRLKNQIKNTNLFKNVPRGTFCNKIMVFKSLKQILIIFLNN